MTKSIRHFIQIVEGFGQTESLYHGTCLDSLWLIVQSGAMIPEASGRSWAGPPGVCLTRSFNVALDHATSHTEFLGDSFFSYFDLGKAPDLMGVVFEFDRAKIAQKIIAFDDFGDGEGGEGSEEEERVIGPLPLAPSLKAIYARSEDIRTFVEFAKLAHENGGSEYDEEFHRVIGTVLNHPLLRPFP